MSIPDLINGAFELTGGFVCLLDVKRLLKDRRIEGVDWRVRGFFLSWGMWNLFYYPTFQQWASLAGGVTLAAVNGVWVYLAVKLLRQQAFTNHTQNHKAYDPNCKHCRKALFGFEVPEVDSMKCLEQTVGYHYCKAAECFTKISDGGPAFCPSHQAKHEFTQKLKSLPIIAHSYRCECDLCNDAQQRMHDGSP